MCGACSRPCQTLRSPCSASWTWQGAAPHVGITPTYSGCPATEVIRQSVKSALVRAGFTDAKVEDVLSPPWTSDWLSEAGQRKLTAYGIAPPAESVSSPKSLL